jgi:hypothetical protein
MSQRYYTDCAAQIRIAVSERGIGEPLDYAWAFTRFLRTFWSLGKR